MDATSYIGERQREQRQPSSSIASSSSTRNKPVVSPRFLSMPSANDFFSHGLDNSVDGLRDRARMLKNEVQVLLEEDSYPMLRYRDSNPSQQMSPQTPLPDG
eukprot:355206_1